MPGTVHIRLLTFNIAHGRGLSLYQGFSGPGQILRNLRRISDLMVHRQVDVAALQEVDEDSHWNRRINLLRVLQAQTAWPHAVMGVNNRRGGPKPLNYGNAILSRHAVTGWENRPFGQAALGEKGFLYAEILIQGHHLRLVNLHLDYRSRRNRLRQVGELIDYLHHHPSNGGEDVAAPIVCGDFNTHAKRSGDAVRELFDYLNERHRYQLFPVRARTFPAHWPSRSLDFVLVPAGYRVRHCEVLRAYLSDHRPVLLEFGW